MQPSISMGFTLPVFSFGQLEKAALPLPEPFWRDRILAQGYRVLIAGHPKVGKSEFFLEMAVRAASGSLFLNHAFTRPLKVLYLQSEIHNAYLHERISQFTKHATSHEKKLIYENLHVSSRLAVDLMGQDKNSVSDVIGALKPDVIGIDPVISFAQLEENSSTDVSKLLYDRILSLQQCIHPQPAIVLVHHLRKNSKDEDTFQCIRGSSAWQGWYDSGILLSGKPHEIILHFDLRNGPTPPREQIVLNRHIGAWQHDVVVKNPC